MMVLDVAGSAFRREVLRPYHLSSEALGLGRGALGGELGQRPMATVI